MLKTKQEEICARFNSFDLHDSKLFSVHVVRNEASDSDDVLLDINLHPLRGEQDGKGAQLRFKDCTIIKLDLDLDGKRVCSDDIMCNVASIESSLKQRIEKEQLPSESEPLAEYLHFHIGLIHPGGTIDVFARDFDLVVAEPRP